MAYLMFTLRYFDVSGQVPGGGLESFRRVLLNHLQEPGQVPGGGLESFRRVLLNHLQEPRDIEITQAIFIEIIFHR